MLYFIDGVRFGILGIHDIDIKTSVIVSVTSLVVLHLLALKTAKSAHYGRW
jgi:hypothetical protein